MRIPGEDEESDSVKEAREDLKESQGNTTEKEIALNEAIAADAEGKVEELRDQQQNEGE